MLKSFTYMFKDSKFYKKALMYFIVVFIIQFLAILAQQLIPSNETIPSVSAICTVLALLTASLFVSCITSGYFISCVKSIQEQKDNYVLPTLNLIKNLKIGFKYLVSIMLLMISIYVPLVILSILGIGLGNAHTIEAIIYLILLGIFAAAIYITVMVSYMGFIWLFAKNESWTTFFRFPTLFRLIQNDGSKYAESILLAILLGIATCIVYFLTIGVFGVIIKNLTIISLFSAIITSLVGTYAVFVSSYICAKSIKENKENE